MDTDRGRRDSSLNYAKQAMRQNRFPPGWNEDRVREVIGHYESLSEDGAVAEDEAAFEAPDQTVMGIPTKLVPAVLELIATHNTACGCSIHRPDAQSPRPANRTERLESS